MTKNTSSDDFLQLKPDMVFKLERIMEERGKYSVLGSFDFKVPCIVAYNFLTKAIKIVENTEEYTEYLLITSFDDRSKYKKVPPGTIRFYTKDSVCFYNGRSWRRLK